MLTTTDGKAKTNNVWIIGFCRNFPRQVPACLICFIRHSAFVIFLCRSVTDLGSLMMPLGSCMPDLWSSVTDLPSCVMFLQGFMSDLWSFVREIGSCVTNLWRFIIHLWRLATDLGRSVTDLVRKMAKIRHFTGKCPKAWDRCQITGQNQPSARLGCGTVVNQKPVKSAWKWIMAGI